MKKLLTFSFLFVCIGLLVACERDRIPVGGQSEAPLSQPRYQMQAKLSSLPSNSNVESVSPLAPEVIDGAALYSANCAACHQAGGTGVPGAFPPLVGSPYVTGDNIERLAAIMIYGLQGPITVLGQEYNGVMAPLGRLKDKELAAIASHIRSSWSNSASVVEEQVFADTRTKYGTRSMFNIEELGAEE